MVNGTYSQDLLFADHFHVMFIRRGASVPCWHRRIDVVVFTIVLKRTVVARRGRHKELVLQGLHGEFTRSRRVVTVIVRKKEK